MSDGLKLNNAPLIEADFAIHWEPMKGVKGSNDIINSYNNLLTGRLYDKVKNDYPYYEEILTSNIMQHRFRKEKNKWPVIEVGRYIVGLEEKENYRWGTFKAKISQVTRALYDSYPGIGENVYIEDVMLRYSNAIPVGNRDLFKFMKEYLLTDISINHLLFENSKIDDTTPGFDLTFNYETTQPKGVLFLGFVKNSMKNKNKLLWNITLQSSGKDAPQTKDDMISWSEDAHLLIEKWFFNIINNGKLGKRYH